ncbi:MAG TPA: hypothetical protein EYN96_03000 [Candidatus Hydrogenedentes bacterium]|nr:hypothetical protein [Candidatus Hydrogenedentota bacterium]
MHKVIIVSSHFSGDGQERKRAFFERLDACLQPAGYRLLLANVGRLPAKTTLQMDTGPKYITIDQSVSVRDFLRIEDLPPEIIMAGAVEAETRQTGLVEATFRLTLFSAYMKRLMENSKPVLCVMWHQFNGNHHTLTRLCHEMQIPYLYVEYGALPGTLCFDEDGQMAESWVAQCSDDFLALPVDESDLARAQTFLDYLRGEKKSGKPQGATVSIQDVIERARNQNRKIIFYAGQNDWAAGMLPRALPEARTHSHIYTDTLDALDHLSQLAEENDWQILFKPHPLVQDRHKAFEVAYPDRVNLVLGADILACVEAADVVTTIVSQVSYLALIHERPCVMLGRNQLRNKGCTGQPATRDEVGQKISDALRDGFHTKARERWLKHIAQMCKYYFFAFDKEVEAIIDRNIQEAADYLVASAEAQETSVVSAKGAPSAPPGMRLTWPTRVRLYVIHKARGFLSNVKNVAHKLPSPIFKLARKVYRTIFSPR